MAKPKGPTDMARFRPKPPEPLPKARVPAGLGRRSAPGRLRKAVARMYGPRRLGRFADIVPTVDWTIPPPNFIGAHNSKSEWQVYAALALLNHDPPDPRRPPFVGGLHWHYQSTLDGGRMERGGQVCDFLVDMPSNQTMCMRLQTEHFHVQANFRKIQQDIYLKTHTRGAKIVDIFEQDFLGQGIEQVCKVVANALAQREEYSPALFGTSRRVR